MSDNTTSTISTSKGISYPNESTEYRIARNQLLEQEMGLRRQLEAVALIRRGLPLGGLVSTDYVFTNGSGALSLSDMFESGKDVLAVYSFMHSPDMAEPCMGCTHLLDALDGSAQHFEQRLNFQVVAKSPYETLASFATERNWRNLRLASAAGCTFSLDYYGEDADGSQMPMLNLFEKRSDGIRHTWGSELMFQDAEPGQEMRHLDLLDPMYNMFDLTPDGRGDFRPERHYEHQAS